MKFIRLAAASCGHGDSCPAVHATDLAAHDLLVQGYEVHDPEVLSQLGLQPGEAVVRIPRSLLLRCAADISQGDAP